MMKQQASLPGHSTKKTAHSRDHRVCATLARVYAMPIFLQWGVQLTQLVLHPEWFQVCQGHH